MGKLITAAVAFALGAGGDSGNPVNNGLTFFAPLNDLGAGAVNLALARGAGSATFARATSATCWSSAGLLLTVAPGVARSTYTELTGGTYLGYLSEEVRTNEVLWCRDLTNAAWTKVTMTAALDQTGIDGAGNSASSLLATAGNGTALQIITEASAARSMSVYMKRITGTGEIDITENGGTAWTNVTGSINSSTYTRVAILNSSVLNPSVGFRIVTSGDKIAVDYVQNELGAFSTTPIATTTVAVTRNADALTFPGAGNFADTAGSVFANFTSTDTSVTQAGIVGANGFAGATALLGCALAGVQVFSYDGTNVPQTASVGVAGALHKGAATWSGSTLSVYINGGNKVTGAYDGGFNSAGTFCIGARQSLAVNGTVNNVKLWTAALTDAQIASL